MVSTDMVEKAAAIAGKAASQPVQWWGALFVISSLVCVVFVVKIMIQNQRDSNRALLDMVKEKDSHIRALNERLINFMESKSRNGQPFK